MISKCLIFTSKSCRDCYLLSLHYKQLYAKFPNIDFAIIDVDDNPQMASAHSIYSLPSIELLDDEQKVVAEFKKGAHKRYDEIEKFIKVYELVYQERK